MRNQIDTANPPTENPKVEQAAAWLAEHRAGSIGTVVSALRSRFALSAREACHAIRRAHELRWPA